jgi:hypothetical protein
MSRRSGECYVSALGWGGVEWGIERVEGSGDTGEVFDGAEVVGVAGEGGGICCEECNREERKGGIYSG